jgi:hypothetical protein
LLAKGLQSPVTMVGVPPAPSSLRLSTSCLAIPAWVLRSVAAHLCTNQSDAVEQASRRWRGGHDSAVAETRRDNLIFALRHTGTWIIVTCGAAVTAP